jgi:hypothetical protein
LKMDPAQFGQFITAEQADRAAAQQASQNQHEERTRAQAATNSRLKAEAQTKRVPACDGSTTKAVREWIREVEFTIPYSERTVYIAARTAEGPLRREVERFLDSQPQRNAVTWAQLRAHVQVSFLSAHEADRLRDEVLKITENTYEGTAAYGRRYRDAADLGYPVADRNADQHRIMKDAYLRGLRDRHIVQRLVREGRPDTFLEATLLVAQYSSDDYVLHRALDGIGAEYPGARKEEPMEVGALADPTEISDTIRKDVDDIKRQVSGMSKQINKLTAVTGAISPPAPPKGKQHFQYKFTPEGLPICVKCNQPGHVIRECPEGKPWRAPPRSPSTNQRSAHQGGY